MGSRGPVTRYADSDDEKRLPDLVSGLVASFEALAALSAYLALRVSQARTAPAVERRLGDVVDILGLRDVIDELGQHDVAALLEMIRARMRLVRILEDEAGSWTHEAVVDPQLLDAETFGTEDLAGVMVSDIVGLLPGLADRLARPDASVMHVGAGTGGLVIALSRLLPVVRFTATETAEAAASVAFDRIRRAGLESRMRFYVGDLGELGDRAAHDLLWVPLDRVAPPTLHDVVSELLLVARPGGWILLSARGGADELRVALARLRTERYGGSVLWPSEAERALVAAGWTDVRSLPHDLLPAVWMTAGRRPGDALA